MSIELLPGVEIDSIMVNGVPAPNYQRIIEDNFEYIQNVFNLHISRINEIIDSVNDLSNNFEYLSSFNVIYPDITYNGTIYIPGYTKTYPEGYYLKSVAVPLIGIENIVDTDVFVKMTQVERSFILSLMETPPGSFQLTINNNSALTTGANFVSGKTITLTQLPPTSGDIPTVKIDSNISLDYYHRSVYNSIPTKPDPSNPYRYKLYSGPYVTGSLRVYVDTHRVADSCIDQTFSNIGEFRFVSTIPLSELPTGRNDVITCDFDIPFIYDPNATADSTTLDVQSAEFYADRFTLTGVDAEDSISCQCMFFPDVDNIFSIGDWLGFTSSSYSGDKGVLTKINIKTIANGGNGTFSTPLGIVVDKVYENGMYKVKIGQKGVIRDLADGTYDLPTNVGKKYYCALTPGVIVEAGGTGAPASGQYQIEVGTAVCIDDLYYLLVDIKAATLLP